MQKTADGHAALFQGTKLLLHSCATVIHRILVAQSLVRRISWAEYTGTSTKSGESGFARNTKLVKDKNQAGEDALDEGQYDLTNEGQPPEH